MGEMTAQESGGMLVYYPYYIARNTAQGMPPVPRIRDPSAS